MKQEYKNTIYLIRHGENPANLTHEFSYQHVDYSLTSKGALQAAQTAEFLRERYPIDSVYSSPLKRAQETAQPIATAFHLPITIIEAFREINIGILEDEPPSDKNWQLHNRIVQDWVEDKKDSAFPGGEDYHSLLRRMRTGLHAATEGKQDQHIVIVGHGGIFTRTIQDICPEIDLKMLYSTENYNCSFSEIELITTPDTVRGTVKVWASHAHLYGEAANVVPGTVLRTAEAAKY
ncbi:histidine phosphatase family protein [Dictyobacter arantiisoli]|uniref:Phosphoglycerate mutase n=1 Tax=Dictyobacter arantiisoli TaxID=2014874 RepID=A0A5A5THY8_9CHLR|nr:histidine phosphatase family protein [Dictyobacter arantiisoli]GCF10997.1 hypothetical protein KDI_45610 [Dictyobacter arantiisoli]